MKSYKTAKFSVLMLFLSLLIAACGLSTVLIINESAKQSYTRNDTFLITDVKYQIIPKNTQETITKKDYAELHKQGFVQVVAVAQTSTHVFAEQQKVSTRRIDITGIDTVALLSIISANKMSANSNADILTSMPFDKPVGIVHPSLLAQLNSKLPSNPKLPFNYSVPFDNKTTESEAAIQTIYLPDLVTLEDPGLGNDLMTDIGEFYRMFPSSDLSRLLLVTNKQGQALNVLVESLKNALPSHLSVVSINNSFEQGELTNSFHMNLLAMALLMFVVCLFIVINAVNLLINARMPWFKICRQLGFSRSIIFIGQIIEVVAITLLASCLGIYLSIHLANIVAPTVQATLEGLYGVEVGFGNTSLLSLFLQVFGISLFGSIAATLAPFNLSKKSLSSRQSNTNIAKSQSIWRRNFSVLAILFAIAAFAILVLVNKLWLLLIATAFLILSGCSVLLASYPSVINGVYHLIPSSFVMLRISAKQSAALSGKTKIACCAFFIAATSNIGMNLMVDSFRGATVSWLETRLASDYYLYYEGNANIADAGKEANVSVFQRFENELTYKGTALQQYSYPSSERFKNAMVFYKVNNIESAWKTFQTSNGIFVNQQFSFTYNLGLNDTINISHPSTGEPTDYIIEGVIYDFGNPYKQVLLPLSQFDPSKSKSTIYSINTDLEGLKRFKEALERRGIDSQRALLNSEQLLAISKTAFDRTFVITDGLNIVTLLVAALSLACAIVVLMDDVRPQNMLIRSFGISTIKTQLLALFQYSLLCVIALLFATPFGILLAWVLIYEINLQAFQWTYPLQISAFKIFYVYAISLSIVLTMILIPVVRASKRTLIEDIRWLN